MSRNRTEYLLNEATDYIAATLEQPEDMRAWKHLLVYCPTDLIRKRLVAKEIKDKRPEDWPPSSYDEYLECKFAKIFVPQLHPLSGEGL